jgi:hypothetical protein
MFSKDLNQIILRFILHIVPEQTIITSNKYLRYYVC